MQIEMPIPSQENSVNSRRSPIKMRKRILGTIAAFEISRKKPGLKKNLKAEKENQILGSCGLVARILRPIISLLFVLVPFFVQAQNSHFGDTTTTLKVGDTLFLGKEYLVPFSLKINQKALDTADFEINSSKGYIVLKSENLAGQELYVEYRYFPNFLQQRFALRTFRLKSDSINGKQEIYVEEYYQGEEQVVFSQGNIQRSGSISRGLSVGNNQSLSVNSGLRLQLEGDLGDDLKLQAAITDESIPIQPDGTTQQINDFDKVFIQLLRKDDRVILGDFEIDHKGTNFANFYRNVQGIGLRVKGDKNGYAGISGAVAKGKFNTNSFQGKERVQGPYRLTGKNGERFIIVLAGSEKVYLNGEAMTRGEGNDYVMDYNSGEVTFTSQRLITSASRIVVDFEYTDRNYNRALLFADFGGTALKGKLAIKGSYGRDADNQNAPIEGPFTETELDSLRSAGDDASLAIVSGVDSVGPPDNASAVRYAKIDTIVYGQTFEAFVFSTDPVDAVYRIIFSNVGAGGGNYLRESSLVNGTVFRWIAPDSATGQMRGDYAPVRVLVPPKLLQVVDVNAEYQIGKKMVAYTEAALSSDDKNRLSPLQDDDNIGIANKTGFKIDRLKINDSLEFRVDVSHKYIDKRYTNLDRVYRVEYGREWNFNDLGERLDENVSEALLEMRYAKQFRIIANAGIRTYGTRLFSTKQTYELESQHKWLQGKYKFTTIGTEDKQTNAFSRWTRQNGDIYHTFGKLRPGIEIWIEDKSNLIQSEQQTGAFRFTDLKPYFKTVQTEKLDLSLYYNYRHEYEQFDSLYRNKSVAHTEGMKVVWSPTSTINLQNTSSLRQFSVKDNKFLDQGLQNSQTLISNFQGSWFTKNRLIFLNTIYEVTSEQLARKQVAYVEVYPGQGDYEWIDADSNGVQSLDEFQFSTNPNRSNFYVRILFPSTELFPTTALNFSTNLKLDMKKVVKRSKNPILETIRNTSTVSNFRVAQKKAAGTTADSYLVSIGDIFGDTSLLDAQYNLRQDVYFFRNDPVGDLKFSYGDNKSKLFLVSGDETRSLRYYGADQRLNFGKSKSFENQFQIGEKRSEAAQFDSRSYNISFWEVKPQLNFQLSRKFRLTTGYEFKHKVNVDDTLAVDAIVNLHKVTFDAKWNLKDRNNIFAKVELVQVAQTGTASFSAEYELRESLQPGFNAIWQVFSTIYLSKNLELSLTYDGRAAQEKKVLHTGRVQLRAYF